MDPSSNYSSSLSTLKILCLLTSIAAIGSLQIFNMAFFVFAIDFAMGSHEKRISKLSGATFYCGCSKGCYFTSVLILAILTSAGSVINASSYSRAGYSGLGGLAIYAAIIVPIQAIFYILFVNKF